MGRLKTCALFLIFINLSSLVYAGGPLQPAILKTEYIENPLGIDEARPRFSWSFSATAKNQFQSAYELIVGDNIQDVKGNKGSSWSSGKVISSGNTNIEYGGIKLESLTRYYWKVRVYNQEGEASEWSAVSWFETAMLNQDDWKSKWIGDGSVQPLKDEDYYQPDRMPLFRKIFSAKKKIATARLYISGLGYYEAYLNGKKIGDHVLDPGWTTYKKQVLYVVHDITGLLKQGNNVAGIMLGNGWWNPLPLKLFGRWDLRDYQQTGRPCVKAEIHVRYADGSIEKIITDESWQSAPGPITNNNVYLGERYDARLELDDWFNTKSTLPGWINAVIVNGPDGKLAVQKQPAIKITREIKPVSVTKRAADTFIVNMGQNFAGVVRLKVKGAAGTRVVLRYGEGLFANGALNVMTTVATQIKKGGIRGGPGAPETAWQEDSYILKGMGEEIWSPRFTFHGFQYVEITGWPGTPTINDIEGLRMNADLPVNGSFSCSNDMLNKLHDVIQWTFMSNVFSVQSDCPGREKMGYGADIVVSADAFMYNYDMANFYSKTVRDYANEQRPKGGMTEIAPFTGIADEGHGDLSGPLGWQLAFAYAQQRLYEFYGDKKIIETYYSAFQKQIEFLQSQSHDNLFFWDISDHNSLEPKPTSFSASAFYYHHVMLAARFAGLLNKREDSVRYSKLAETIRRNIVRQYYVGGTGRFDNGTQAAQLFALYYDLSPEKDKSFDVLLKELERNNWRLTTGIFSTKQFFDVMQEFDRPDIIYKVVNQTEYPGWGYMLSQGATTLWESWSFPETGPSRNHPMFGSVDEWFYRGLLGINATAPGFSEIMINPQVIGDLNWAKGSYRSPNGVINIEWKKEAGKLTLKVIIPPNTKAMIRLPAKEGAVVREDGVKISDAHFDKNHVQVERGSGEYLFEIEI